MVILDKAIDMAKKATEADKQGKYEEAINLYGSTIEHFMHAIKYEIADKSSKEKIRSKVREYLSRSEFLKEQVSNSIIAADVSVSHNRKRNDNYRPQNGSRIRPVESDEIPSPGKGVHKGVVGYLDMAINAGSKASAADLQGRPEEALELYNAAIKHLEDAIVTELIDIDARKTAQSYIRQYQMRASIIRDTLNRRTRRQSDDQPGCVIS